MEQTLYEHMQNLLREKGSENATDVKYLGVISMEQSTDYGPVTISKDVFAVLDIGPDGSPIIKYYDEKNVLLGGRDANDKFYPSPRYANENIGFLHEIDNIDETKEISLKELDYELEEISKMLGLSKEEVLSMSKVELDSYSILKDNISFKPAAAQDKDSGANSNAYEVYDEEEQNNDFLDQVQAKQEINLDNKIDDRYTLADILGVPSGSELIVVHSDIIQDNVNSTHFSCIIRLPDGSLKQADMLNQVGGKDSDKNVYETNRDGSEVEKKSVKSSFAIDTPLSQNGIITIKQGSLGTIEVGYGQMDQTSHKDAFTQKLETREMYPVTRKVREEFNRDKGEDNIPEKMDEIKKHENNGCSKMTLEEADGDPYTGHGHSEDAAEIILSDTECGDKIDSVYTKEEIMSRFETIKSKNPDKPFETLVEMTKEELDYEADFMRGGQEHNF